jgi:hypothetical protein
LRGEWPAAHHRANARPDVLAGRRLRENPVETVVAIVLIVVSALEIIFVIRIVQSNMPRG